MNHNERGLGMEKKQVLLLDPIHISGVEILERQFDVKKPTDGKEIPETWIRGASALVVRATKMKDEVILAGEKVEVIGKHGIGVDNINVPLATRRGIIVVNTPEANVLSVAEHALTLMLALVKRIVPGNDALHAGKLATQKGGIHQIAHSLGLLGGEISGKEVGIMGMGKIGRELASRCKSLGMVVFGYDPWVKSDEVKRSGVERLYDHLPEMAREVDILSVHVPFNETTKNSINKSIFDLMKPGSWLINCSRGGIVDEAALAEAVKSGRLAGAGVDVFATEPPGPDCPLLGIKNIILTPHAAGATQEALVRMAVTVAEEISIVLGGRKPRFMVNPQVWDSRRALKIKA
jgi:D-3-phosphoglycerate dehydrogenase / 2-oxoglutarate reductase